MIIGLVKIYSEANPDHQKVIEKIDFQLKFQILASLESPPLPLRL